MFLRQMDVLAYAVLGLLAHPQQTVAEMQAAGSCQPFKTSLVVTLMGDEVFLQPLVFELLADLKVAGSSELLFEEVLDLNRFKEWDDQVLDLDELLNRWTAKDFYSQADTVQNFINRLTRAKCGLEVRITPLRELLEFQFALYPLLSGRRRLPVRSLAPVREQSAFIDPRNVLYVTQLREAMARLFPETNHPPRSVISVNGGPALNSYVIGELDTVYVGQGDTVRISAASSDDADTPRARFRYAWRQIDPRRPNAPNLPPEQSLGLDASDTLAVQVVVPHHTGTYWVGVTVNDQVADSEREAIAVLNVIEKPSVTIKRSENNRGKWRQLSLVKNDPLTEVDRFLVTWTKDPEEEDSLCLGFRGERPLECGTRQVVISDTSDAGWFVAESLNADSLPRFEVETSTRTSQELIVEPRSHGVPGDQQVWSIEREWSSPIQVEVVGEWLFGRADATVQTTEGETVQIQGFSESSFNLAMQLDVHLLERLALVTSVPLTLNQGVGLGRFLPDIGVSLRAVGSSTGRGQARILIRALPTSQYFLPDPEDPNLLARGRTFWYASFGVRASYRNTRVLQSGFEFGVGPGFGDAPEDLLWDLRFSMTVDVFSLFGS